MSSEAQRLRDACNKVRTSSMPLSDLIPLMQQAADALDRLAQQADGGTAGAQAIAQLRHLVDDLVVTYKEDGLDRHMIADGKGLLFSNMVGAAKHLLATPPTAPQDGADEAEVVEPCGWSVGTGPKTAVVEWGAKPPPGWVGLPSLRPVYTIARIPVSKAVAHLAHCWKHMRWCRETSDAIESVIAAYPDYPSQGAEGRQPLSEEDVVALGRVFSANNEYEHGRCVRVDFTPDQLCHFARALLSESTNGRQPLSEGDALARVNGTAIHMAIYHIKQGRPSQALILLESIERRALLSESTTGGSGDRADQA